MKGKRIAVISVICCFISVLIVYTCLHFNDQSNVTDTRVLENTQYKMFPDDVFKLDGFNAGPKPSWLVVPMVTGVDSIPINQSENRQISKQNTKISFVVSRENTFRGYVEAVPEDLPVSELADILLSAGIDPSTPEQDFLSDPLGRFYYSVDLSYAEPLCYTSSHELVCKLKNDSSPSMLIVLDAPTPKKARFYLAPSWDITSWDFSVLINGEPVTEEEEAFYRELFRIHALGTGYLEVIILDGDVVRTEITIVPKPFFGITYTFFSKAYKGYETCVIYSVQDGCMVFAE